MSNPIVIGLDLGGSKISVAVGNRAGDVLQQRRTMTLAALGPKAAIDRIMGLVGEVCAAAGVEARHALGFGVGAPGPLDVRKGVLLSPPNLGWQDIPLRDMLERRLDRPVTLTNDCKAGGYGELRYGAARGLSDVVYLGIGTGIGGCLIVAGRVYYGATGNAGEFGHVIVDPAGPVCACGRRGCLEAIASGGALARAGAAAAATPAGAAILSLAGSVEAVDAGHVFEAAQRGDPLAGATVEKAVDALGSAVAGIMNGLGPQRVVLGGGVVARTQPEFVTRVEREAHRLALPSCAVPVVRAELGEDSVVKGAFALAWDRVDAGW